MTELGRTEGAITFIVGAQEFCVDIMSVAVVCRWRPLIPLLHAPVFVCGLLHIGGAVWPVIDVAVRLGLPTTKPTKHHIIVVVEIAHRIVGLLVEGGVSELLLISMDMIQPMPDVPSQIASDFVSSTVAIDKRRISLISLDAILPRNEQLFAA